MHGVVSSKRTTEYNALYLCLPKVFLGLTRTSIQISDPVSFVFVCVIIDIDMNDMMS